MRDIAIVTVNCKNSDSDGAFNSEDCENVIQCAVVMGHEFESHANRSATGSECSEYEEHWMTEGNYGKGTPPDNLSKYSGPLKNQLEELPDEHCSDN